MQEFLNSLQSWGQYNWNAPAWFGPVTALAVIWTLVWKGMGMWKASQNRSKVWFIVLLVVNTLGILDILYIYVFSKKRAILPPMQ